MSETSGRWRRLLVDYGMLIVLVLLCAVLSLMTIEEQEPRGATAGSSVAGQLLRFSPAAAAWIAAGDTVEDREFVAACSAAIESGGGRVTGRVNGDPRTVRTALEAALESGVDFGAIVTLQSADAHRLLAGAPARYPQLATCPVLTPAVERWSTFLTRRNLINVTEKIVVWAVIGIGMTLVILTAGIDLSVGSLVALSSVVSALLLESWGGAEASALQMAVAVSAGILAAGLVGLISGLVITLFDVAPFIVTLGMMMAASGLALRLTNGESVDEVPASFSWIGHGTTAGVPRSILLMLGLFVLAYWVMAHTTFGRSVYAVGGNREAARLAGIPVKRVLILVYTLCGLLAGIGGWITASTFESGDPNYGQTYELYVIAAVVVGGTSLKGGEGRVLGTLIGALILGVIYNGMNLTNVGGFSQRIVLGVVILGSVVLDRWKRRALGS